MTNTLPDNLDTLVREAMEEWQVPGLALAVTRDGEGDWIHEGEFDYTFARNLAR